MLGYTQVKGRGKLHAYNFAAETPNLPYQAEWLRELRQADSGGQAVLEVQAVGFGELVLIYSQHVREYARAFGYTQSIQLVPEAVEKQGGTEADAMAKSIAQLLYYPGFYTPEAFLDLDDNADEATKVLDELRFPLPEMPAGEPQVYPAHMIASLLAELWKACDLRNSSSEYLAPIRVCLHSEEANENTLDAGRLFVAKTLIPKLPEAVRNILSITIGADWSNAAKYTKTACCIVQPNRDYDAVGYSLHKNNYSTRLISSETAVGMALLTGEHIEYYADLAAVHGTKVLCTDFTLAVYLVALAKYLNKKDQTETDLNDCTSLWHLAKEIIHRRLGSNADEKYCRRLLYKVERDILELRSKLSNREAMPQAMYRELMSNAFDMQNIFGSDAGADTVVNGKTDLSRMRDIYASFLVAVPAFSEAKQEKGVSPFEVFLADENSDTLICKDFGLFAQMLKGHLEKTGADRAIADEVWESIGSRVRNCPQPIKEQLRTDALLPHAVQKLYNNERISAVTLMCEKLGLQDEMLDKAVMDHLVRLLKTSDKLPEDIALYFRYANEKSWMRDAIWVWLDKHFARSASEETDWQAYVKLYMNNGRAADETLPRVFAYLQRYRNTPLLNEQEMHTLLGCCAGASSEDSVMLMLQEYFNGMKITDDQQEMQDAQMQDVFRRYPAILSLPCDKDSAWGQYQGRRIKNQLEKLMEGPNDWDSMLSLPSNWNNQKKDTDLIFVPWEKLLQHVDEKWAQQQVADMYLRVMGTKTYSGEERKKQLASVGNQKDWMDEALYHQVACSIYEQRMQLWSEAEIWPQVTELQQLLEVARPMAVQDTTRDDEDTTGVTQALALLQRGKTYLEKLHASSVGADKPPIAEIAANPDAHRIAAILENWQSARLNTLPFSSQFAAACLCSVRHDEQGPIDWERVIGLMYQNMGPEELKHIKPWTAQGQSTLRALLMLLKESDAVVAMAGDEPLVRYLQQKYPRLSRAANNKREQRRYLRAVGDFYSRLSDDAAIQWCGQQGVAWLQGIQKYSK